MFSIFWKTRSGVRKSVVAEDFGTALEVSGMLRTTEMLPSLITDMSTGNVAYQHVMQEGDTVHYCDQTYVVVYTIPGLPVVGLRLPGRHRGSVIKVRVDDLV